MNGDKLSLAESLARRAEYWRRRRAAAATAAGQAAIAWDQVRGEIQELPAAEQDAAWSLLIDALDRVGCQFDTRVDTPSAIPARTDARAGARGTEPNTSTRRRPR